MINEWHDPNGWKPTMNLRWKPMIVDLGNGFGRMELELQQYWTCNNGESEWRKIEIVD